MRLRSQQAHVSAVCLVTSAAAHNRTAWAAGTDAVDTEDEQHALDHTQPYSQRLLSQHPEEFRHLEEQNQALTYDELLDARRITAAATGQWRSDDQRLAQLKRKWPFDPRPSNTASAVKHARRGTCDKLLHSGAAVSHVAEAEADPVPAGLAPEPGPTHDAAAPQAASAAAPAAAALSIDDRDADSTDTVQRPQKRVRRTPTDRMREEMGLPPRAVPQPAGTWTCINMRRAPTASESQLAAEPSRLAQCAHVNSTAEPVCTACGAARWDGDDGQLAARVSAILQTSDLGTITLGGVVQRLEAESGSAPGAGLQFGRADVKREVDRQLSLRAQGAQLASSGKEPAPAAAAQAALSADEAPVAAAAARLHRSIALLAQQQGSSLALRRRLAARAAAVALPALDAAVHAHGAAASRAAAEQHQVTAAGQGADNAAAAGDAATAAGLDELRPWPLIQEEAEEAGGAAGEDEAVDVAGDWEQGPGLAGIPAAPQGGAAGGEEAADATASAAEHGAPDPPQLRSATHHGCNFAVTLLETLLHRKCSQPSSMTPLVMRHLPPDRKFMGVPVAAGTSDAATESDGDDAGDGATTHSVTGRPQPTNVAAVALHGLRTAKWRSDGQRPALLLNPWPSGETASPQPAARTLPASTLDAVLSSLLHYSSHLDELPKSWFQQPGEQHAEDSAGSEQVAGAASSPGSTAASSIQPQQKKQQQQHAQAAAAADGDASDATTQQPDDCRSAFTATGAPGQPPPRPAHRGAGWRRRPPWVPHNLYCVAKRSGSGSSTSFWYEDAAHPSRYGSLHKFRALPGLPVSAVAQRGEETLDTLGPQLARVPPDVRAVFAAAAEMGLPSSLLADVLRRYAALQQPQQGQGEAGQAEPVSEGESDVSTVSDGVQ